MKRLRWMLAGALACDAMYIWTTLIVTRRTPWAAAVAYWAMVTAWWAITWTQRF